MSSRRRRLILLVPSFHCSTSPASRSTRKWWVRVDLVIPGAKLPQGRGSSLARQFGDDAAPLRVAQRVEDGGEVEGLAIGVFEAHTRDDTTIVELCGTVIIEL